MGRPRRDAPTPHREFFRAVTIDETVALACTCRRGVDHWYAEPNAAPQSESGTRIGGRSNRNSTPEAGGPTLKLRAPHHAGPAW
jgi:hypothetical protein